MIRALIFALISLNTYANLHLAPADFESAIFIDFKKAEYFITYDIVREVAEVKSKIIFESKSTGHPIFDLIPQPKKLKLNGQSVNQGLITFPGNISKLRKLSVSVNPGLHTLEMVNEFNTNTVFNRETDQVSSGFFIRDLRDRMFLEQYLPSNFEFDQYQMTFHVKINGPRRARQDIYTNGLLTATSEVSWKIDFPEYFTVSCPYFHITPKKRMKQVKFSYPSISGQPVAITIYSPSKRRNKKFKTELIKVMKELERDYGPWAHPSLVVYGTGNGKGGMEHSGATATAFKSLDHEMLHSYFAKGIMPANGNSGWIDEAIASWRDKGYRRHPSPGFSGSNLGGHSPYQRHTDDRAYGLGSAFMAYLDYRLQNIGGLKAFLRGYFQTYKHQVITTEHFKNNLEFFLGIDLREEFETYIFGVNSFDSYELYEENPHHGSRDHSKMQSLI